jgi:RHS repeat-associated protein
VYGVGRIAQVSGSATHYYLSDGLGSTMALTDEAGAVVNDYDYDVFGALRDSSGSQDNDFTFAGEQVDGSTGLQYLRARYYDVGVGRFLAIDPAAPTHQAPITLNRFAYAANNPGRITDPMGLYLICQDSPDQNAQGCYDSTSQGLPPCDTVGNCYIWYPDGISPLLQTFGTMCVFAIAEVYPCYTDVNDADLYEAVSFAAGVEQALGLMGVLGIGGVDSEVLAALIVFAKCETHGPTKAASQAAAIALRKPNSAKPIHHSTCAAAAVATYYGFPGLVNVFK